MHAKPKPGQRVETVMGVRRVGVVTRPRVGAYTDGSYREPQGFAERRDAVWVTRDDGTFGWQSQHTLVVLKPGQTSARPAYQSPAEARS